MLTAQEKLNGFVSTLDPNKISNLNQRRSQLTFINSLVDFVSFQNILDVYSHDSRVLNTWCGIESWCCKDSHDLIYDVDIRIAWSSEVFRQNLVDHDWKESTLLSGSDKKSRCKLIIYFCKDTLEVPNGRELHTIPRQFLVGQYWQEIYHLYLKAPSNDFFHGLKFENLSTPVISTQVNFKADSLAYQSEMNMVKIREDLDCNCKPLVSIITVVKNGEKYIEQTIQSVINQTYHNIEYIIVDGGSTDGTLDIIKKYENKISYWISESDDGISDAFNKGVSRSNGFLVGILSADDLYFQNSVIERMVAQSKISPESSFYFGNCLYETEGDIGKILGDDKYAKKLPFYMPHIHHPTVLMKREVLIKMPFSTLYKLCMDYHLFLQLNKQDLTGSKCDEIITIVRNCGVSNRLYYRTRKEVFKASTEQGTNVVVAGLIYIILVLKYWVRNA
jgi:Glycosyl transferase family 2